MSINIGKLGTRDAINSNISQSALGSNLVNSEISLIPILIESKSKTTTLKCIRGH
jgi:hypothetical protein